MTKSKKRYVFITIIVVILCGLYSVRLHDIQVVKAADEKCTTLQFEQDTLELGRVRLGENVEVTFRYTNTGKHPLIIKNVQVTCGCTEANWNKEPLSISKSREIKVIFKAENEGQFMKSLFVVCNVWEKVHCLQIKGSVFNDNK